MTLVLKNCSTKQNPQTGVIFMSISLKIYSCLKVESNDRKTTGTQDGACLTQPMPTVI